MAGAASPCPICPHPEAARLFPGVSPGAAEKEQARQRRGQRFLHVPRQLGSELFALSRPQRQLSLWSRCLSIFAPDISRCPAAVSTAVLYRKASAAATRPWSAFSRAPSHPQIAAEQRSTSAAAERLRVDAVELHGAQAMASTAAGPSAAEACARATSAEEQRGHDISNDCTRKRNSG